MGGLVIITVRIQTRQGTSTVITVSQVTASHFPTLGRPIPTGLRTRCFRLIAKGMA